MAEVAFLALMPLCVIKNEVLIFKEKGCQYEFLRTLEDVRECVRKKSAGLGDKVVRR